MPGRACHNGRGWFTTAEHTHRLLCSLQEAAFHSPTPPRRHCRLFLKGVQLSILHPKALNRWLEKAAPHLMAKASKCKHPMCWPRCRVCGERMRYVKTALVQRNTLTRVDWVGTSQTAHFGARRTYTHQHTHTRHDAGCAAVPTTKSMSHNLQHPAPNVQEWLCSSMIQGTQVPAPSLQNESRQSAA